MSRREGTMSKEARRSRYVFWGESPRVASPFPVIESLDAKLLKGGDKLYLGAVRGTLERTDASLVALSPGAFRLRIPSGKEMGEEPWVGADVAPFLLAATAQRREVPPKASLRALIRLLPDGPAILLGRGAPLGALKGALLKAGRALAEAGAAHPSLIALGRRPSREALLASVADALPGAALIHMGLLEELPLSAAEAALAKGVSIVAARWGAEDDSTGLSPQDAVLLSDSPQRLRSLLARLRREEARPRAGRSPDGSA